METILLRDDLQKTLEQEARLESKTINEIVNEAVENYVRDKQRRKIDKEIAAFEAMHNELKRKYLGEWIAIDHEQLVDHDIDRVKLYKRVRAQFGRKSVLIRQVQEQAVEEIWIRTPSTGKAKA
ncbi:MAG: hypothetical protein HZB77_08645 [Chloroflexi bacterium]|nr:hypothetical protein [Chloroflexota bacterium]